MDIDAIINPKAAEPKILKEFPPLDDKPLAIIDGKYKLLSIKDSTYLYNIYDDPGETTDLSQSHRKVLERLSLLYEKFIGSCKDSFDGKEYGTESVERMDQTWKY